MAKRKKTRRAKRARRASTHHKTTHHARPASPRRRRRRHSHDERKTVRVRAYRRRKNGMPWEGLAWAVGTGVAGLGLATLAAQHKLIPDSILSSPTKSGLLWGGVGVLGGLALAKYVKPEAGLGFAGGVGGFGLYAAAEAALSKAKTSSASSSNQMGSGGATQALPSSSGAQNTSASLPHPIASTGTVSQPAQQSSGGDILSSFGQSATDIGQSIYQGFTGLFGGDDSGSQASAPAVPQFTGVQPGDANVAQGATDGSSGSTADASGYDSSSYDDSANPDAAALGALRAGRPYGNLGAVRRGQPYRRMTGLGCPMPAAFPGEGDTSADFGQATPFDMADVGRVTFSDFRDAY